MSSARAPSALRGATRASLRALAGLVAVLLALSSLGQVAHFLIVPHAICAEHGELVELTSVAGHAVSAPSKADGASVSAVTTRELSEDHDHCQVLSRGQRELSSPTAGLPGLPHAACEGRSRVDADAAPRLLAALTLAPKTSPPLAFAC